MKTTMTAVLGLSMLIASAFAAQDASKTNTSKDSTSSSTSSTKKVKKHKKAAKPADSNPAPAATPSK